MPETGTVKGDHDPIHVRPTLPVAMGAADGRHFARTERRLHNVDHHHGDFAVLHRHPRIIPHRLHLHAQPLAALGRAYQPRVGSFGLVVFLHGTAVAAEQRCAPYRSEEYAYPQAVEDDIIQRFGGLFSPYTNEVFESKGDTDIEHVVARSEAHDSGLCRADTATKRAFSRDLLNLTLANPRVNRNQKGAKDAAEWRPEANQCWFAQTVVAVRRAYQLTIDRREAAALDRILAGCSSTEKAIRKGLD